MKYSTPVHEFIGSCKRVGFLNSCRLAWGRIFDMTYDFRYKIDTDSRLELDELDVDRETASKGQKYQPTGVLAFYSIFSNIQLPENSVLVDYGCGKGRVLLLAATLENVKKTVGIEFSQELCDIAEKNVESFQQTANLQDKEFKIVCCDASRYEYEDDETVFYFFFPFDSELMERTMNGINDSLERNPREAVLISYYTHTRDDIEAAKTFQLENEFTTYGYDCLVYRHKPE